MNDIHLSNHDYANSLLKQLEKVAIKAKTPHCGM